jgi:hypothetical protein
MSVEGGISAFDRFRAHLEDETRRCPACGCRDAAEWTTVGVDGDVAYRRVCTACDAEWIGWLSPD